jgi:hypothetical protein
MRFMSSDLFEKWYRTLATPRSFATTRQSVEEDRASGSNTPPPHRTGSGFAGRPRHGYLGAPLEPPADTTRRCRDRQRRGRCEGSKSAHPAIRSRLRGTTRGGTRTRGRGAPGRSHRKSDSVLPNDPGLGPVSVRIANHERSTAGSECAAPLRHPRVREPKAQALFPPPPESSYEHMFALSSDEPLTIDPDAGVAQLADARVLGARGREAVGVRIPPPASDARGSARPGSARPRPPLAR